ncbi:MAG: transglutaminase domain-containing protein [Verrucomicrobia bacterium]|nr:transglutaminase domain-containing protein [Verrucomicrobiota bacterium]
MGPLISVRRFCILLLVLGAGFVRGESASPQVESEQWGIMLMQGKRVGFMNTMVTRRGDSQKPQWISDIHQQMKLKRLGMELLVTEHSRIVENDQGLVLNFEKKTQSAGMNSMVRGYRVGNELAMLSRGMEQRCPFPPETIGPRAFGQKMRAEMPLQAGSRWKSQAFMIVAPQAPAIVSMNVNQREPREVQGKKLDLWNATSEISVLPGLKVTVWMDADYQAVVSHMSFPGIGDIDQIMTTREEAMRELESAELFAPTLITPSKPLNNVSKLSKATFRLSTNGSQPLTIWSGGEQVVSNTAPGIAEVTVTVPHHDEAAATWVLPSQGGGDLDRYLQQTPYLEIKSQIIQELAHQAVGNEKNPLRAARKIEAFVRGYIRKKDLSVAFASAGETARSRQGDCTEHAVLAAALGRAVGLPTRIVNGIGYLPANYSGQATANNGLFGFHMWAEAWLGENQWVTMDAALNGFDVGHIAIAKIALQETNPMIDLTVPLLQAMEKLKIDVLSAE